MYLLGIDIPFSKQAAFVDAMRSVAVAIERRALLGSTIRRITKEAAPTAKCAKGKWAAWLNFRQHEVSHHHSAGSWPMHKCYTSYIKVHIIT